MIDWNSESYHPVVNLPEKYKVLDLTKGSWDSGKSEYSIGRYNELRPNVYTTELFAGVRNLHVGIDIGGPVGTPCMAFDDGEISHFGYNPADGDYGYVIITKHLIGENPIWALYGHLSAESIKDKKIGQKISRGETICWMGDKHENGGWESHLHFQLSVDEPETHDMPGVVSPEERESALKKYPDPRMSLGPIY